MRSVLHFRNQVRLFDTFSLALQQLPHVKGAMPKPVHQADLSPDPLIVVGRCSRQAGVKELVTAPGDVYGYRKVPAPGTFNKQAANFPCSFFIKSGELKLLFFPKQLFQYIIHVNILSAKQISQKQHSGATGMSTENQQLCTLVLVIHIKQDGDQEYNALDDLLPIDPDAKN